jgi:hypothetical protein
MLRHLSILGCGEPGQPQKRIHVQRQQLFGRLRRASGSHDTGCQHHARQSLTMTTTQDIAKRIDKWAQTLN